MNKTVRIFLLILTTLFFLLPPIWMVLTSFKPLSDINTAEIIWIPRKVTLEHYVHAIFGYSGGRTMSFFVIYVINSLIAALISTFIGVFLGLFAGYSFSRLRFRGRDPLYVSFVLMRCIPGIALSLPLLVLYSYFGLIDTLTGLILIYSALNVPFAIWIMKSFFDEIPRELDEAAEIDGCSPLMAFLKVLLPLSKPGIAASSCLIFLFSWVEYPIAFVITSSTRSRTVPPGIFTFMAEFHIDWGGLSAASSLLLIPAIIIIILTQKYIVRGLTFGAVKG